MRKKPKTINKAPKDSLECILDQIEHAIFKQYMQNIVFTERDILVMEHPSVIILLNNLLA